MCKYEICNEYIKLFWDKIYLAICVVKANI